MNSNDFDRIHDKLDVVRDNIAEINVTLAKQHISLVEHMRRTALLEEETKKLQASITPIQKHVAMVQWALKAAVAIAVLLGGEKIAVLFNLF